MFQPQRRQPSSANVTSPTFGETNSKTSTPAPATGETFEFGSNGTRKNDDDVYSGFERKGVTPLGAEGNAPYRTSAGRPLQTGGLGFGGARSAIQSRMGMATSSGAGADGGARPMTSMRAAGYSSRGRTAAVGAGSGFDPFNQAGKTLGLDAGGKPEQSIEELVKILERKVNSLIEESTFAAADGNFPLALEKAKEAGKKERQLTKQREQGSLSDQINLDLTYCVLFNLANQYHGSKMYQEALNTYGVIVKNKLFNQSGRLRVNMGNIYFEQKKYSQAIKMYRMALDQIPNTNKDIRLKIMRNIGSAFVKMGQFQDAITSYEAIMEASPSFHAGFNLVLCYFAMGDRERMKKGFSKLVATRPLAAESSEWEEPSTNAKMVTRNSSSSSNSWGDSARPDDAEVDEQIDDQEVFNEDSLRAIAREHCKAAERYIIMAAKLVAPAVESTFAAGFDWVAETIRTSPMSQIASELEIAKAIQFLKTKEFAQAIETLKAFEKKDQKLVGTAATNLSFLYFLEGENKQAEKYADIAIHADRYNAKALTNRGNGWFARGNYEKAREYYSEAVSVDATCTEAMYNLGLVYKQEEAYEEAFGCFEKLHAILRNHAEVIYQMADICDKMDNLSQAMEWFNILISVAPTDPGVLARMGEMFLRDGDKSQAFQYYSESYRYFPSNMDVIAWLGAYYVDCAVYEQAIQFFERAAMIQPKQVRWPLMVASCYRRSGNYQMAYEVYKKTHENFPDDVECLRFLVRICTDLGAKEVHEYTARLAKAEKMALESPLASKSGETNDHSSFTSRSGVGKVERGSAGSTSSLSSSGRRKAVKFDLGIANELSFSEASSKKPSGQAREDEDWQDDVDMLLPD